MAKKTTKIKTDCCISGGGPAGMMLGFLLARAGVDVVVLEKYPDFFRDFRGDTVHPSTLEVMYELGVLEEFLKNPHQKVDHLHAQIGDQKIQVADFSHLKVHAPYIAFMPQWDFLNFLATQGKAYPHFKLMMGAQVNGLREKEGKVVGAKAETAEGEIQIESQIVVGADGRHSTVRPLSGLTVEEFGVPIDVLWFHLSRKKSDPAETMGRFLPGKIMILIDRGDYWQCGYVIPKGEFEQIKQGDLATFRQSIAEASPFLKDRVSELKDWDQVKLLTVQVDRLQKWYRPGLLCIGDAAHAMSPVGGVGINLAIQDAVAAANQLAEPLKSGNVKETDLAAIQKRRLWAIRVIQRIQLFLHNRIIYRVLGDEKPFSPPLPLRLLNSCPFLRRIPGHLVGMGVRPEHVKTKPVLSK